MWLIVYNLALLVVDVVALLVLRARRGVGPTLWTAAAWTGLATFGAFAGGVALRDPLFASLTLLTCALFWHAAGLLFCLALLRWRAQPALAAVAGVLVLALFAVWIEAFERGPYRLEVTHYELETERLDAPLRIVVLADIQTDEVGDHERAALRAAMDARPDLILMAGDYVHGRDRKEQSNETERLNRLMHDVGLSAPLGVYAVAGNTDWLGWQHVFDGLPVRTFGETVELDAGPVRLTCLSMRASFDEHLRVARADGFHVVLGHAPDFALGAVDADLLVAGHCHGGQVRLPFVGPLVTLSQVPRGWTSGLRAIRDGTHLFVSRGIGMERGRAPRMRFLCPPEVAVIDVRPAPGRAD